METVTRPVTTREAIDDFIAQKRIAVVGVSRNEKEFSRTLFAELARRGYDVIPVTPNMESVDGKPCYASVRDITPPPHAVMIMTNPEVTGEVVRECNDAGIKRVWLHRGEGIGAVSQPALDYCQANNMQVVPGFCILWQ